MTVTKSKSIFISIAYWMLFLYSRPVYSAWIPSFSTGSLVYNRVKICSIIHSTSTRHKSRQRKHSSASLSNNDDDDDNDDASVICEATTTRRDLFIKPVLAMIGSNLLIAAASAEASTTSSSLFTRQTDQFAYQFQPPSMFEMSKKPLKTHLDEVIFKSINTGGYQIGITIDPVRINSLQQFGTADEVAAKVVLAEVNRDGVFDVTLMQDAYASSPNNDNESSFYQLNYQSKGTRGTKRFVTKFYVSKQKLYALTAQCKEDDYAIVEKELLQAVDSFLLILV